MLQWVPMKNIIIAIVVLAVLVGGYFYFNKDKQVPAPAQGNAKINIDAVCEGALAYMTFENGEKADLFVKDCKEGKHPEVIEKYKADMNLGAGAQI